MASTAGEQLKEARENHGLSIGQVAKMTHVREHYLEALEANQRDRLPSAVQARGFLRLYADALGLPVEPLLAAWDGKPLPSPPSPPVGFSFAEEGPVIHTEVTDAKAGSPAVENSPAAASGPASDLVVSSEQPLEPLYVPDPPRMTVALGDETPLTGSQQVFNEIGETLRRQREGLGLSLAEVERYTRLRQHYIQAMEAGRMDGLPSPVQGRGMLSNYAAFLNLDEERLLLRFAEGLQLRRVERIPKPEPQSLLSAKKRPARPASAWRKFMTPDLIFGVGLAGIILFFAIWSAARISSLRAAEVEPTTPPIAEILQNTPASLLETDQAVPGATSVLGESAGGTAATADPAAGEELAQTVPPSGEQPAGEEPNADETPGLEAAAAGTPPANQTPAVLMSLVPNDIDETPATAAPPPASSAPLQVYIVSRQRAWLMVSVDGQVKFQGRTVPGNAYPFTGSQKIEMLTGNAAALQVFYNQEDLGVLGTTGEVVGLVFSPEGMMTPTPAFTATPTVTPPATLTPLPSPTLQATPTITPFVPD